MSANGRVRKVGHKVLHSPTGLGNPVASPAIVVADDDAPSRLLIARYLQQLHLSNPVVEAANGQQAIEVLAALETTPALVLLDVNMPEKSGLQVLAWIRDHARLSPVPVVILTGSAELEDVDQAYGLGISAYLLKPLSSTALDDALRALGTPWMLLAPESDRRR